MAVDGIHAIAFDSIGLKRFERSEWHQEKQALLNKANWRKLHAAVSQDHYFEGCACKLQIRLIFAEDPSARGQETTPMLTGIRYVWTSNPCNFFKVSCGVLM